MCILNNICTKPPREDLAQDEFLGEATVVLGTKKKSPSVLPTMMDEDNFSSGRL